MKILVFADTHGDLFAIEEVRSKAKDAEFAICLGDITFFEQDLEFNMEVLNDFPIPFEPRE